MNNRNEFVESFEDVHKYLEKMIDNAKKHGIMITAVFTNAPLLDKGVDCITPYGKKHPELVIHSCAKAGLEMVNRCEDSLEGLFKGDYE